VASRVLLAFLVYLCAPDFSMLSAADRWAALTRPRTRSAR
jgi:hypothetical protein